MLPPTFSCLYNLVTDLALSLKELGVVDQALSMHDDDDAEDEGNSVKKVKRGSAGVGDLFREDDEKTSIALPKGGVVHSLVLSPVVQSHSCI